MTAPPALKRCEREGCQGALIAEDVRTPNGWWLVEWRCFACGRSPAAAVPFEEPVREVRPIPNPRQEAAMRDVAENKRRLHRKTA